jgi:hypothetical protein
MIANGSSGLVYNGTSHHRRSAFVGTSTAANVNPVAAIQWPGQQEVKREKHQPRAPARSPKENRPIHAVERRVLSEVETYRYDDVVVGKDQQKAGKQLNLSALKGEDSQATLRITTLTLAPEGSHRPHASGF